MIVRRGPVVVARPVRARVGVPYRRPYVVGRRYVPRVAGARYYGPRFVGGRWIRPGLRYGPRAWWSGRYYRGRYYPYYRRYPVLPGVPYAPPAPIAVGGYPYPRRPWIFRQPPPAWLLRALTPYATAYEPPPPAEPPPAEPPPAEPAAPPPPSAAAAPPPPEPPPQGGGPPPPGGDAGGGGDGGQGGQGELPSEVMVDGQPVPIRWASAPRELGEIAPQGGGVYLVLRNGVPEAAHVTGNFASDVARRYGTSSEEERGYRRRYGRRSFLYGRMGGRFGRYRRYRFLRSLRYRMGMPDQGDDDQQEPPEE